MNRSWLPIVALFFIAWLGLEMISQPSLWELIPLIGAVVGLLLLLAQGTSRPR